MSTPSDVSTIVPPPYDRYYVERTASLVSRKGSEFEKRMMIDQAVNPEFNFFRSTDPYHAYYKLKLAEYRAQHQNQKDRAPQDMNVDQAPPEVRFYVERTALLVSKKGSEFEKSMMSIQERNPEFRFFRSSDRYHEYYKRKLAEFRAAKNPEDIQLEHFVFEPQPPVLLEFPNFCKDDIPNFLHAQSLKPRLPRPNRDPLPHPKFFFELPEWMSRKEFENIKLAAQAVARDGYVHPEFEFMRPTDFRFNYFDALAAAYSERKNDPFASLTKDDEYEDAFQRRFEAKQALLHKEGVELTIIDVDESLCLRFLRPPIGKQPGMPYRMGMMKPPSPSVPEEPELKRQKLDESALFPEDQFPVMFSSDSCILFFLLFFFFSSN